MLTQSIFGNHQLAKKLVKDSHITYKKYQWTKDVYIFFDIGFAQDDTNELISLYQGTIADVKPTRISSPEDYYEYFNSMCVFNH